MNRSPLLVGSRLQLINQLVYFDEEKTNFLNHYFPENNHKRSAFERILSDYTSTLEKIVADLNEDRLNSVALIGSRLELRYVNDDWIESFTIVFPQHADPNHNLISFLSPMGIQLLMSQINETYQLAVPSGVISVKVEDIKYVNSGDIN
ncbi:GreA/GreB family elongation factor [Paenibacillus sp. WQ 127069]|uniref:GreA/GreB family elongation factor n=1 Tax=Paenibacillus baimaensis TaxID=2982185 RepID=A0ABT2UQY4_9BACL|nr:GreA/GreB family elongation factor [Paenibacillus sp. WQ 127069]MCU6797074.1 GreA/GreB family elongation factor [Paenibacillus sp. WQ 127069]